jgi:adenylate cyclase
MRGGANYPSADRRSHPDRNLEPINLATQAPIRVGALTITPALRQVVHDDGREQIIEPRVMQVLVALLRADGQIVTRDDLLTSCWRGVVVGEDAIGRVIGSLRRLSEGIGAGAFKLETITKVGYRLVRPNPRPVAGPPVDALAPLLAVLAFDNLCEGDDMAWFTDGISEEIQQTLARGADLKVIGRASSFQFRGASKAAANVAAELGVTHVLDGSVRRSANSVRITAELIDCQSQTSLWSQRFDRDLANIFALQDEIAVAVANALKIAFTSSRRDVGLDPIAIDLYLRARNPIRETQRRARIEMLQQVVQLAPQFAPGWAALADARAMELRFGEPGLPEPVTANSVRTAAETALQLDARAGLAYAALGGLEPFGRYFEREALFRKAVDTSPNDPLCLLELSWFEYWVGRVRAAREVIERAYEVDPLVPAVAEFRAAVTSLTGDYVEGCRQFDAFFERWPTRSHYIFNAVAASANCGDWDRVDAIARRLGEPAALGADVRQALRTALMRRRPSEQDRQRVLARMGRDLEQTGAVDLGRLFLAYSIGLRDEAFRMVDASDFGGLFSGLGSNPAGAASPGLIFMSDPNGAISEDRRFVGLCVKLGLCDYWLTSGNWPDCADPGVLAYDFKTEARRLAAA